VTKYRSWWVVLLFGMGYGVVGIAFPNPSIPGETQFIWRLAAWVASTVIFGIHIWCEHFRFNNQPRINALHGATAVALGAFALAVAANIHSLHSTTANHTLLVLSLILWPIIAGLLAFVVSIIIAMILKRIKPFGKP